MARVAVAHDQPLFARLLRSALAEQDAELVGTAGTAEEAIRLVRELEPDVLLLDLALSGAFDVLEELHDAPVQMVGLAPKDAVEDLQRAAAAGVDAFIRADAEPAEVALALRLLSHIGAAAAGEANSAPPPSPG
jgi:two-component system nitrate/nitrite response regulator NarL